MADKANKMTLIKSISGIRGTIGGEAGSNLTPVDIIECTAAYAQIIKDQGGKKVVIGRDGRMTGEMLSALVSNTLMAAGLDVVDFGLSTTPGIEMAVSREAAAAGIILTASHNPREWNALKFLNGEGEFISPETGQLVLEYIRDRRMLFADVDALGKLEQKEDSIAYHVEKVLALPYLNIEAIRGKNYHVVIDAINSTGALALGPLLEALACTFTVINGEITGDFAHNPEPLPEHLNELSKKVLEEKADLGISVDPDVDRLAFVMENGEMFGEEYTLVACADFILSRKKGNTVSNLSSTRALSDLTQRHGGRYYPAKVGEVNVVNKMKEVDAVIGGEGNGGVILPELHYGRDAVAGVALFLSLLADRNMSISKLKKTYPAYAISKNKVTIVDGVNPDVLIGEVASLYADEKLNLEDGLKIDFPDSWVQLRKSNTEPILRVYAEAETMEKAQELADRVIGQVKALN
jgi:phosphomannomutase